MAVVKPDPKRIVVPRTHGAVLIEPALSELQHATATTVHADLRTLARQEFLAAAQQHARNIGLPGPASDVLARPWIITGHQVEFYHAGVWAKVVAADELARRRDGVAFDLLVDHDVVDHLGIDVPVKEGDNWKRLPLVYATNDKNLAADGLTAPDENTLRAWRQRIEHHFTPGDTLREFLDQLAANPSQQTHTQWLSRARRRVESSFGLNVHHVPTSLICAGRAWSNFVRMWIEHAAEWTAIYNKHLEAYRRRAGIKSPQHPMPNLQHGPSSFELPFWLYRVGEPRHRLFVRLDKNRAFFLHEQVEHDAEKILAGESDLIVRPRALTLTMFTRLFLGDIFIHGIGGALYDQITDGIMQELFNATPTYGCVSAAWLLPLGQQVANTAEDIAALRHRRHHLQHNPQLAIDAITAVRTDIAELIQHRREAVALLTSRNGTRAERLDTFRRLHAINAELHAKAPRTLTRLDDHIITAQRTAQQNKTLLWREYFWPLHTRGSLQQLVNSIRV